MSRLPKIEAGQWVRPNEDGYLFGCCDCGLVHLLKFRIVDGRIEFQAFRDEYATAELRQEMIADKELRRAADGFVVIDG